MTGTAWVARKYPNILIINVIRVIQGINGVTEKPPPCVTTGAGISECEIDVAVYIFAGFLEVSLQLHKLIFQAVREIRGLGAQR